MISSLRPPLNLLERESSAVFACQASYLEDTVAEQVLFFGRKCAFFNVCYAFDIIHGSYDIDGHLKGAFGE